MTLTRALPVLLLVSCGGLDKNVESQVTITQGVYGQLLAGCDTPGCSTSYLPSRDVGLFDVQVVRNDAGVFPAPLVHVTSRDRGFYEIGVDAGSFFLAIGQPDTARGGTSWFTSTSVRVPVGVGRVDWVSGPGGGNFTTVK